MNSLALHGIVHPLYYHHPYAYHHGYGGSGWIANMVVSAVVHSLIYGLVFRLMRHLTTPEAILLVGAGLLGVFMWSRARDRRGW